MDKKIIYIFAALSILITVSVVLLVLKISSIDKKTPQEVMVHLQKDHREFIPQVPSKMDFCGEEVPLID